VRLAGVAAVAFLASYREITDHRFGGNSTSPDVGRPLDGFGDGLRVTLISKRKNVSQYSGDTSANFVPTKNKVYHLR
jgi:hypothetical protein